MAEDIHDLIRDLRQRGEPFAVATVVETAGSVSAKTASKAVIDREGRVIAGWVGGGCAESRTCEQALDCMHSGRTALLAIDLDADRLGAGLPCGGSMRVYVEPVLPRPALWILGHGRVAEALCQLGDLVGLRVMVVDPDAERARYPDASRLITADRGHQQLQAAAADYVVIATQHTGDHESLQRVLAGEAGYIALIASRKRARLVLDYLRQQGFSDQDLGRVMAPAGLDLGARTPEEIALCVISEIVLLRRAGSGVRLGDRRERERHRGAGRG